MKKIIVIGCSGSGKSVFSRELNKLTGIPLIHLDNLYWNADKSIVPKEEFAARLKLAMSKDEWIIDGNYGSTMEMRMDACDTVFFFDLSTEVCLEGIRQRRGKPRIDIPWIEEEGEIDFEFLSFVERYNTDTRPCVIELLEKHSDKSIIIFKSRAESEEFLNKLKNELT